MTTIHVLQVNFKSNLAEAPLIIPIEDPTKDLSTGDIITVRNTQGVVQLFPRENIISLSLRTQEVNDEDSSEESQGESTTEVDGGSTTEEAVEV